MKYIKSIGFGISIFLILNLIITIFSFFNLFNDKTITILKIIVFIITMISSGFILGFKTKKKGLINGLKLGLIYLSISLFLTLIIPNLELSIKLVLYYLLIIILNIFGSVIGVNIKKTIK